VYCPGKSAATVRSLPRPPLTSRDVTSTIASRVPVFRRNFVARQAPRRPHQAAYAVLPLPGGS
jgi:hypothetical protein